MLSIEIRLVELLAAVRVTRPLNPFVLANLTFVEFVDPKFIVKFDLAAVMLKSTPATETLVDADKDPAIPVTVITPFPVVEPAVIVRVALAFPP